MPDTLIRFHCPQCNKRLKADAAAIGRRARCTRCGCPVAVPPAPEPAVRHEPPPVPARAEPAVADDGMNWFDSIPILASPTRGRLTDPEPPARPPTDAAPPTEPEPDPWAVDPVETSPIGWPATERPAKPERTRRPQPPKQQLQFLLDRPVIGSAQAKEIVAQVQEVLPVAPSAYRPSGRVPASALLSLMAGAGAGAIVAAIVRTVLVVAGVLALSFFIPIAFGMDGFMKVVGAIVLVVGSLVYFAGVYFAAGVSTAYTVRLFGAVGKCRSPAFEATTAAASAALAMVGLLFVSAAVTASFPQKGVNSNDVMALALVETVIGGAICVVTAAIYSASLVKTAKFCEPCEAYMRPQPVRQVPLPALPPIVAAVRAGDPSGIRSAIIAATDGTGGTVEIHRCPRCRDGFLEVLASCSLEWTEGKNKKSMKPVWLTESRLMSADELERALLEG